MYKISKILSNRLKPILPSTIGENQTTFVEGRNISDNIFLAQELFHGYHLKKSLSRVAIKVDIKKACDTIRWTVLWDILDLLGLSLQFIRWIHSCISSASFSVSINGGLHGFFSSSRGLRQGDPLYPYLFVLGMNVLAKILECKTNVSEFKFHWHCAKLKLTCLYFADDLLLLRIVMCHLVEYLRRYFVILKESRGLAQMRAKVLVISHP